MFSSYLGDEVLTPQNKASKQKKLLPAVSTSLALAAGIGLLEMLALIVGSGTLMNIIGIPVVSKTNLWPFSDMSCWLTLKHQMSVALCSFSV